MRQSLLEIYRKHFEANEYKLLNTLVIDSSYILKRNLEYWIKDSKKVIIEIIDENICFLYKEYVIESE